MATSLPRRGDALPSAQARQEGDRELVMNDTTPPLQLWFEFASTYSYLAIEQAPKLSVPVHYQPFLLGPIFAAQGWSDSPFNLYPVKGQYMWRDMERLCEEAAIPLRRPSRFPR